MMAQTTECKHCTVPTADGSDVCAFCKEYTPPTAVEKGSLDEVANLVEAARGDLNEIVRSLDDDAPLLTVADLYAAAAHLRKAGALIDQAAEQLEAR